MGNQFNQRRVPVFTLYGIKRDFENDAPTLEDIGEFVRRTEQYGYAGILLPESNNGPLHPWVFAQTMYTTSQRLHPFIAINPVYAHPFFTAKYIANVSALYNRRLYLNYITGTAKADATGLNDPVQHTDRYRRLLEYMTVVNGLLGSQTGKFSFEGDFYTVREAAVKFRLSPELLPVNYVAGNSDAALGVVQQTGSARLRMALPADALAATSPPAYPVGFHLGILTRPTREEALGALAAFSPVNRSRQMLQQLATKNANVAWKSQLLEQARHLGDTDVYNLVPFKNFDTDVPYLVGSYEEVAACLARYLHWGINLLVVEIPITGHDEFAHISRACDLSAPAYPHRYADGPVLHAGGA